MLSRPAGRTRWRLRGCVDHAFAQTTDLEQDTVTEIRAKAQVAFDRAQDQIEWLILKVGLGQLDVIALAQDELQQVVIVEGFCCLE